MKIILSMKDLNTIHKLLPDTFTFTNDSKDDVVRKIAEYTVVIDGDRSWHQVEIKPKWTWNKRVVGYRDTRTNVIYYNTRIKLNKGKLLGLSLHEAAHCIGYQHCDNNYISRKMQNKLWYDTERKLKSVPYQLTKAGEQLYASK